MTDAGLFSARLTYWSGWTLTALIRATPGNAWTDLWALRLLTPTGASVCCDCSYICTRWAPHLLMYCLIALAVARSRRCRVAATICGGIRDLHEHLPGPDVRL